MSTFMIQQGILIFLLASSALVLGMTINQVRDEVRIMKRIEELEKNSKVIKFDKRV